MGSTPRQVDRNPSHLLLITHLEISTQNISLVLSCEPHPKCKPKATYNCIKRTLRKVTNPCTQKYKHRCFPPGGNNTSPRLMFLSLKLDIGGHEPPIEHNALSWSYNLPFAQSNKRQRRTCNYYSRTQIYYSSQSENTLIIHQIPANST